MKKLIAIAFLTLTTTLVKAERICKDYIRDEWPDSRYTIEIIGGDNIVIDNETELMWKQCSEGLTGNDCSTDALIPYSWGQALDLASLEVFAGFSDWRVPNQKELRSIAVKNCYNPSINENAFPNTSLSYYWTSTPNVRVDNTSWIVYFNQNIHDAVNRNFGGRVRLVRNITQ